MPTRRVHRSPILALVSFYPNVRLPLAFQVALLSGDSFFAPEQAVAAEVLVAFLDKAEPRFIPDQPVVQQFLERGVDVALALEQFVPLRHTAFRITHHTHRAAAMITRITDALPTVAHDLAQAGIVDTVIGRLVDGIGLRVRECREGIK